MILTCFLCAPSATAGVVIWRNALLGRRAHGKKIQNSRLIQMCPEILYTTQRYPRAETRCLRTTHLKNVETVLPAAQPVEKAPVSLPLQHSLCEVYRGRSGIPQVLRRSKKVTNLEILGRNSPILRKTSLPHEHVFAPSLHISSQLTPKGSSFGAMEGHGTQTHKNTTRLTGKPNSCAPVQLSPELLAV